MTREGNWDGSRRKKLTGLEEEGEKGILQARKKVPLGVCRRQGLWPWSCRCVTLMGGAQEGKSPQGGMVCLGDGAAQEGRQTQRWTPPCVDTRPTTREPAPPPRPNIDVLALAVPWDRGTTWWGAGVAPVHMYRLLQSIWKDAPRQGLGS